MVTINKKEAIFLENKFGMPLFLYDENEINKRVNLIRKAFKYDKFKILYAVKANANVSIVKIFKKLNLGIDASSPGDVFIAKKAGFSSEDISATGPNWTNEDLKYFIKNKITVDLDSISQIERYGALNPNSKIGIRINPGIGTGSNKNIIAGGEESKLGIQIQNIESAINAANKNKLKIIGIHYHIGSSSFEVSRFIEALNIIIKLLTKFNNLEFINIGGGYGVKFGLDEKDFDMNAFGQKVVKIIDSFNEKRSEKIELRIESGEFLMWPSAIAIGKVNSIKKNNKYKFVGIDINSNCIPTPQLCNSYHKIRTFSKKKEETVTIAGNLCQAGDILAKDRKINRVEEGDFLIIENVGAYCMSRTKHFNSRLNPAEVLRSKNGKYKLIRKENIEDLLMGQIL